MAQAHQMGVRTVCSGGLQLCKQSRNVGGSNVTRLAPTAATCWKSRQRSHRVILDGVPASDVLAVQAVQGRHVFRRQLKPGGPGAGRGGGDMWAMG